MDFALDIVTGRRVRADAVRISARRDLGRYKCPRPACGAFVFFQLRKHGPRFVHYPHQGSPDCDLYYPGMADGRHTTFHPSVIDEREDTSQVGIELKLHGTQETLWALNLRLPKVSGLSGEVTLRLGPGRAGLRPLELSRLGRGSVRLDVIPCHEPLGVTAFDVSVPHEQRVQLVPRAVVLPESKFQVFHAGGLKRKKMVGQYLYWGASYYLISSVQDALSVPDVLRTRALAINNAWSCELITLPRDPTVQLESWFANWTDREVARRRANITVLAPTLSQSAPGAITLLGAGSELVIGIHRLTAELLNDTFEIESASGLVTLQVQAADHAVVAIQRQSDTDRYIFLRFGAEPGVLLNMTDRPSLHTLEPIRIFTSVKSVSAPVGSVAGHRLLQDARKTGVEVVIEGSHAARGVMSWRRNNESWKRKDLMLSAEGKLTARASALLKRLVADPRADLVLSLQAQGTQRISHIRARAGKMPELLRYDPWHHLLAPADQVKYRYSIARLDVDVRQRYILAGERRDGVAK